MFDCSYLDSVKTTRQIDQKLVGARGSAHLSVAILLLLVSVLSKVFLGTSVFYCVASLVLYLFYWFLGLKSFLIDSIFAILFFLVGLAQNDFGSSMLKAYDLELPRWAANLVCVSAPILLQFLSSRGLSWFSFLLPAILAESPEEVLISTIVSLSMVFILAQLVLTEPDIHIRILLFALFH